MWIPVATRWPENLAFHFTKTLTSYSSMRSRTARSLPPRMDHMPLLPRHGAKHSVHLLIEKPIADTLEQAHRILKVADEAGIRILVGHHRRHNLLINKARSLVQGGAIGKLVAVSVLWTLLKPADYYRVEWRCRRPGGGPTLINLIHEIDSLRFVCGEIRQVYAQASSASAQAGSGRFHERVAFV